MSVENLDEIIPVVDGLANNKAAVFSYTEQAYQDNDVNGVSQYDFSREQNIPDRNSTDTNAQVLTKGFRSQGASIPRNFLNHFIGRFSYNLNKMVDMFKSFLTSYKTDYRKNGFMYNATLQYQVGDVCMDVWTDHTFAFFIRTGNGGSAGVRPMVADGENWTTSEHWACLGSYAKTAQSFALRDKTGKIQVADPTDTLDAANKSYVDSKSTGDAGAVQDALDTHISNKSNPHTVTLSQLGVTSTAAELNKLDGFTGSASKLNFTNNLTSDAQTQLNAKATTASLNSHTGATTGVHGATSDATANKIAIRDGSGRLKVNAPSDALDATNRQTVVSLINDIAVQSWIAIDDMKFGDSGIFSVTYGNGKFVAVGTGGKGAYSTDGITWTVISDMKFGTLNIQSITYGNGKFVAVGTGGKGAYSTDGITWTAISDMKLEALSIQSITYGNGKFVAVTKSLLFTHAKGAYSTDGITWTVISDMKFGTSHIQSITYGNGKFVAVGASGKGAYSTDGITWTAISDMKNSSYTFYKIVYGDGKFVAVGGNGVGSYSTDGINWKGIGYSAWGAVNLSALSYGNHKFVVSGAGGKSAYSTDGITWTAFSDMKFPSTVYEIAYGNNKFIAVGGEGTVGFDPKKAKGSLSLNLLS